MTRAIDYLCGDFTPEGIRKNFIEGDEREILERIGKTAPEGREPKEFMANLSKVGVEKILVVALISWNYWRQRPVEETTVEEIVKLRDGFQDRIYGLFGVNPLRRLEGVKQLERVVKDHDFKGAHVHPHGWRLGGPNHAWFYPYYAKCAELGIPVVITMGHTMDDMPLDAGRPSHVDEIALYFPELPIVIAHTGWPWVEEALAVVSKHPNVYLGTSAYSPKYWKPEMVQFLNSRRGRGKVLFGTDYPIVAHAEAVKQIEEMELREESKQALLYDVAARLFKLD